MTDTEKATLEARIDELCAEVERLRVANAAFTGRSIRAGDKMACLEAENAKLREERREYQTTIDSLVDECIDHKAENAKLRKLVSVMDYCMQYERECDGCALNGGGDAITEHAGCDGLREMLRELGIEVA